MVREIRIEYSFYLFAAIILLIFPLNLILAWALAVIVHEMCHYIATRLCGVEVEGLSISAGGINMETGFMSGKQELFCSLAGPFGGLCLLFLARWLPYTAICAFAHSIFNLLPLYPLDGGRALRCIVIRLLGERVAEVVCIWVRYICIGLLLVALIILSLHFNLSLLSVVFVGLLLLKFKLANKRNK